MNTNKIKILFVVPEFPIISHIFIYDLAKFLMEKGHEVDFFVLHRTKFSEHDGWENLLKEKFFSDIFFIQKTLNFSISFSLFYFNKDFLNVVLAFFRSFFTKDSSLNIRKIKKNIFLKNRPLLKIGTKQDIYLEKEYDIIHCQFGNVSNEIIDFCGKENLKSKVFVHFRGHDISSYLSKHGENVYKKVFEKADFFLANCDFFKEKAISLGCNKNKISTYGTALDISKFSYVRHLYPIDGRIKLITIGRLAEKKGIKYGIIAVAEVVKKYPNIEYVIVGGGPLRKKLEDLSVSLGLENVVKFVGQKQHSEVSSFLKKSHIFLSPNVVASNGDMDAPTNTIKEAMASGVLVVSSNYPSVSELIQNDVNGFLVEQRNGNKLADKIMYVINNPEIWNDVAEKAREDVVAKYEREKLGNGLIDLYQKVINEEI